MKLTADRAVLIISHDVVGERMAGPGIRYYHLSRVLSDKFDVTLAVPDKSTVSSVKHCELIKYHDQSDPVLIAALKRARLVFVPVIWVGRIADHLSSVCVVVDGYDPFLVETLALGCKNIDDTLQRLTQAVLLGDFFVCASERQRDWWLGLLEANGRINPHTFAEDASLRRLVDVVPYGLPESEPQRTQSVVKGVWPGIASDDKVVLWGGGLWPWLDPLTAIRAIAKVWQQRQDVRLIFPGTRHPNPEMEGIPTHTSEARELASEQGLLNKVVFFGDWVPYEDWPSVLLESDLALTLHYDTLETRLAFRSRVLDYIWAGLPVVATRGDATSSLISTYEIGTVTECESVEEVAAAILRLLTISKSKIEKRFEKARRELRWDKAAEPLVGFCQDPRKAPDKVALGDRLGNPYYVADRSGLAAECEYWRELVRQYEQGRFMRLMRGLHQIWQRIRINK